MGDSGTGRYSHAIGPALVTHLLTRVYREVSMSHLDLEIRTEKNQAH